MPFIFLLYRLLQFSSCFYAFPFSTCQIFTISGSHKPQIIFTVWCPLTFPLGCALLAGVERGCVLLVGDGCVWAMCILLKMRILDSKGSLNQKPKLNLKIRPSTARKSALNTIHVCIFINIFLSVRIILLFWRAHSRVALNSNLRNTEGRRHCKNSEDNLFYGSVVPS